MELIDGKYRVIRILGKGGCGAVYVCEDPSLGKQVAVKVMLDSCEGASDIKRFRKEAQALSMCDHPGIVKILAFGTCNERSPYYVMEFVDGQSLSSIIANEGPLAPGRFSMIFDQVLSALQHAHEHGLVHRDIKPSNIMVARIDDTERAFLIDFGLIRNLQSSTRITSTNAVLGTPFYMSPEQCTNGNIDQRSDLYALGCTMYECATGTPPFTGEALEVLMAHLNDQPEALPAEIAEFLLKCLAKDPDARFSNAEAARECLRDLKLSRFPGFTRKEASRVLKALSRNKPDQKRLLVPALIFACVAVVGLSLTFGYLNQTQPQSSQQKQQAAPAEDLHAKEKALSNHNKASQLVLSKSIPDAQTAAALEKEAVKLLDNFRSELDIQNSRMDSLLTLLEAQAILKAPYNERLEAVTSGLITATSQADKFHQRKFYLHRALLRAEAGEDKKAAEDFAFACSAADDSPPSNMDDIGQPYIEYSRWLRKRNEEPRKRITLAAKAVTRYQSMTDQNIDYPPWWLDGAMDNLMEEKNLASQKSEIDKIIQTCLRQVSKDTDPRTLVNHHTRAARLMALAGESKQAKKLFQEIIQQSLKREPSPQIATAASIHFYLGHFPQLPRQERIKYAVTAYEISKTDNPLEQHAVLSCLIIAAQECAQAQMYKEARYYYSRVADLSKPRAYKLLKDATQPDRNAEEALNATLVSRLLVAQHSLALHDPNSAKRYLAEAKEILKDLDASKSPLRTSATVNDIRRLAVQVTDEVSKGGGGSSDTAPKAAN